MLYDFGPRLLKLRKDKNLTQQMVVERAKGFDPNLRLSDSVLGKYESDLAVPRLTEAAALADVLNVSLDYLTSGEKCNVLSLKELSPEQVQLLMDLTAHIRTKKRRSQGHKNVPKPTTEETELITRLMLRFCTECFSIFQILRLCHIFCVCDIFVAGIIFC